MSTPQTSAPEWQENEETPWFNSNKRSWIFDAFAMRTSVLDRDLATPPGTCPARARYLIAGSATGAWAGHDGELAIAMGENASNGWTFAVVEWDGLQIWIEDEETQIEYVEGTGWVVSPNRLFLLSELQDVDVDTAQDGNVLKYDLSNGLWYPAEDQTGGGGSGLTTTSTTVSTESGTSYDVAVGDVDKYIRLTNAGAKTINVRAEATHALAAAPNGEWHFRNAGAGEATFVPAGGVTINPPVEGSLSVPGGGTVTLKRIAADTFDLFGITSISG